MYIADAVLYHSLCTQNAQVNFCLGAWSDGRQDITCKNLLTNQ